MNMIRWNPAYDLLNVHSELERVFSELVGGTGLRYAADGAPSAAFLPVDVKRQGDQVIVEASVPGFRPEEVNVTVDNGLLTISAQHVEEREDNDDQADFLRRERYVGRYYRQISIGDQVDSERAQAVFENGVLRVSVPLVTRPEPRRIRVDSPAASGAASNGTGETRGQQKA